MDRLPDTKLSSSCDGHQMSLHRDLCSQCSDLPLKNLLGTLRFLIQTVYHTVVNDLVFLRILKTYLWGLCVCVCV